MANYKITIKGKGSTLVQGKNPKDAFAQKYPNIEIVGVEDTKQANVCIELQGGTRKTKNYYMTIKVKPNKSKTNKKTHLYAVDIMWDVDFDEDDVELPREVRIPDEIAEDPDYQREEYRDMLEGHISDWLSDTFDFCHEGFRLIRK